ncbi:unnamed protein product [Arctogadus glacialis]
MFRAVLVVEERGDVVLCDHHQPQQGRLCRCVLWASLYLPVPWASPCRLSVAVTGGGRPPGGGRAAGAPALGAPAFLREPAGRDLADKMRCQAVRCGGR